MYVNKININQTEQTYDIVSDVYDVSAHNNGAVFESLQSLLSNPNLNTLIPLSVRCGGMTIRFVQSSDNKYVQYRYMGTAITGSPNPFLNTANWQGVDDKLTDLEQRLRYEESLSWSGVEKRFNKADLLKYGNAIRVSGLSFAVNLGVYAYYYENGESKYILLGVLSDSNKSITTILDRDLYMIYFYSNDSEDFDIELEIGDKDTIFYRVKELHEISFPRFNACKIIKRAGCIGDSFTEGDIQVPTEPPTYDIVKDYAWTHYMEILTGHIYENWGQSGSTSKKWVNGEAKLSIVKQPGNKCQVYIIGLMINDRGGTLGTTSDINTDADSYYAWYYKLIQEVINVNPEAIIICNTCPLYQTNDEWNNAVRNIVNYCRTQNQHVLCCDIASEKYKGELYYGNPMWSKLAYTGHPNLIGHEYAAECYYAALNDLILNNYAEFQSLHRISYDEKKHGVIN